MNSASLQFLNVVLLAVFCFALIEAKPHSQYFQICNEEISKLNVTSNKRPCMMACVGVKEGWLSTSYSMNVTKKLEFAKKFADEPDKLAAFTTAINACKDIAMGSTDYCTAGTKIHDCMRSNNAPHPGHGPPQ